MNKIEFFFDFVSPYAYLAQFKLPAIAAKYGYEIECKPINLSEAKLAAGNNGPATAQIPAKFRYAGIDLMRWAKKYGAPFVMPALKKPANPEEKMALPKELLDTSKAHKGFFYAQKQGKGGEYVSRVYHATFGSGGFAGDDEVLRGVAEGFGWDADEFFDYIHSDEANALYEACNAEAHSRGIFGVPTMIIGDQMWWGNDRLSLMEEYLEESSKS